MVIQAGDFTINLEQCTAALRGRELRLTPEELDVLVYLAGHPESYATPRTVLATKWTANQPRKTAFLRALISLRKKLEAAEPGSRYRQTEWSVTYRFDPTAVRPSGIRIVDWRK
jgi:DNA-binding response OmpR family regulator